jgi:hypothetical protein
LRQADDGDQLPHRQIAVQREICGGDSHRHGRQRTRCGGGTGVHALDAGGAQGRGQ